MLLYYWREIFYGGSLLSLEDGVTHDTTSIIEVKEGKRVYVYLFSVFDGSGASRAPDGITTAVGFIMPDIIIGRAVMLIIGEERGALLAAKMP